MRHEYEQISKFGDFKIDLRYLNYKCSMVLLLCNYNFEIIVFIVMVCNRSLYFNINPLAPEFSFKFQHTCI
jgi:hypothetical protein